LRLRVRRDRSHDGCGAPRSPLRVRGPVRAQAPPELRPAGLARSEVLTFTSDVAVSARAVGRWGEPPDGLPRSPQSVWRGPVDKRARLPPSGARLRGCRLRRRHGRRHARGLRAPRGLCHALVRCRGSRRPPRLRARTTPSAEPSRHHVRRRLPRQPSRRRADPPQVRRASDLLRRDDLVSERRLFWWDRISYMLKHSTRASVDIRYPIPMTVPLAGPGDKGRAFRLPRAALVDDDGPELP